MTCFGGHDVQLYLMKLTVEKLEFIPEKFQEIKNHPLVVKIKLVDLPIFEVSKQDFHLVKHNPTTKENELTFAIGKCCLFIKQPRDLMKMIQSEPIKIGIFCVGDNFPIAETEIPLSGCLCDQVTMASNDLDHLPKPYTLRGGFNFFDPGNILSGILDIEFQLSCLGKSFTANYQLCSKSFIFKTDRDKNIYCVKRVLPPVLDLHQNHYNFMEYGDDLLTQNRKECLNEVNLEKTKKSENKKEIKSKNKKKQKKKL